MSRRRSAFSLCLLASVVALCIGCSSPSTTDKTDVQATVEARVQATLGAVPTATAVPPTPVATRAPATVPVLSDTEIAARGRSWLAHIERGAFMGSGIVVGADGYVLTNEHVVHDSGAIHVGLADGRTLYGDLVGTDPKVDLALIHVPADDLQAATFGDPSGLQQGDPLIIIGYALNLPGEPTITRGVFSGHRANPDTRVTLLQTDAAMNPGVSGGGMLDRKGALVGINVAGIRSSNGTPVQGINFAIPADLAQGFVQSARGGQLSAGIAAPTVFASRPITSPSMVVDKPFGAALRAAPSSDATIITSLACGQTLEQLEEGAGGWFRVRAGALEGWMGGARLEMGSVPSSGACAAAPYPPYGIGNVVRAHVQTGCLSVRPNPSASASITECVPSGYVFALTNGPIEVDGEDWFGVRGFGSGLTGWTRAAYLVR